MRLAEDRSVRDRTTSGMDVLEPQAVIARDRGSASLLAISPDRRFATAHSIDAHISFVTGQGALRMPSAPVRRFPAEARP